MWATGLKLSSLLKASININDAVRHSLNGRDGRSAAGVEWAALKKHVCDSRCVFHLTINTGF